LTFKFKLQYILTDIGFWSSMILLLNDSLILSF